MKVFDSLSDEVVELLKSGAVGVIPTDTIYGVVAVLRDKNAVEKIYSFKERPIDKRVGTTLIASSHQLRDLASPEDLVMAEQFWPGASVEMRVSESLSYAHKGHSTLAFRLPRDAQLIEIINQTGPLATSSANKAGERPANTVQEAIEVFGKKVDFYVDGGDLSGRKPSRIVRIEPTGEVTIIRG